MPMSEARATTAASEPGLQAESALDIKNTQPINPKIDNPTARKRADQARDMSRE
jgi:hypothetical protein